MLVESLGPAMAIMDESQLESDDEMGDDDFPACVVTNVFPNQVHLVSHTYIIQGI
jgi:hypothetical protein